MENTTAYEIHMAVEGCDGAESRVSELTELPSILSSAMVFIKLG
jgi:hypothetical protein